MNKSGMNKHVSNNCGKESNFYFTGSADRSIM